MVGGVATWIDPCVSSLFYADTDSDGYGDNNVLTVACAQPVGYVSNGDDCDDSDANIGTANVWYLDADNDGYGDNSTSITACEQPVAYVTVGNDCNDSDASTNLGAVEVNDGYENNCDGNIDDQPAPPTLLSGYADANTFEEVHGGEYSSVNFGSDTQPQILVASTQMTSVVIYPASTTTAATVIPFLVDADYKVIVRGETYTINTTAGAAYEIVFDSPLSASEPFYFGCYQSFSSMHNSGGIVGSYRFLDALPQLNSTISYNGANSARSTQGYGYSN